MRWCFINAEYLHRLITVRFVQQDVFNKVFWTRSQYFNYPAAVNKNFRILKTTAKAKWKCIRIRVHSSSITWWSYLRPMTLTIKLKQDILKFLVHAEFGERMNQIVQTFFRHTHSQIGHMMSSKPTILTTFSSLFMHTPTLLLTFSIPSTFGRPLCTRISFSTHIISRNTSTTTAWPSYCHNWNVSLNMVRQRKHENGLYCKFLCSFSHAILSHTVRGRWKGKICKY